MVFLSFTFTTLIQPTYIVGSLKDFYKEHLKVSCFQTY